MSPPLEVLDALYEFPILITGAGGSIGSALALRLATLGPPMLLLLEASESHLYNLQCDWRDAGPAGPMAPILGSVTDQRLLEEVFAAHAPRIVLHTAAFKHVPMLEEHPLAAIANNIFGTLTLATSAVAHGARLVLLSTDKAVEPASIMGATKRVAEQIVQVAGGTVLRLGNVLGTRGCVAEVFARQIARGGPITVTDPNARRYFITVDEAVNMLLIAAARTVPSALLAPVLPASHSIVDLANFMVNELAPESEIPIEFTGTRPGDKDFERMWPEGEKLRPVHVGEMVSVQTPTLPEDQLEDELRVLRGAVDTRDLASALASLGRLVPSYKPSHTVMALSRQYGPRVHL